MIAKSPDSAYRSPISPGLSFYERSLTERPGYGPLDGDMSADVAIIGGGFTGLSAALHLASHGSHVVLIDAARFGDGASGRNGGQMGTGQRIWNEDLASSLGIDRARELFSLAEDAKRHLLATARLHDIDMEYRPGQISAVHKRRLVDDYRRHVDTMAETYGYEELEFADRQSTASLIGSDRYHASVRDGGTGHINPLKLVTGLAKTAAACGAVLAENTAALAVNPEGGRVIVQTRTGSITAQHCLIATNGHGDMAGQAGSDSLDAPSAAHVMPIGSFIAATEPLPSDSGILPGDEACDDSRFVVRYFRKSTDNRLLFGGREAYGVKDSGDLEKHMHRQIGEVFPQLKAWPITDIWGGKVAITMQRLPFIRETSPGVTAMAGFSGHGVMLANYCGRLYAETLLGNRDRLKAFRDLDLSPFPGGRRWRQPLLFLAMNWFALRDRL